ncbi:response regulator transcription factor [Anaerococcus sp. Marseille-Q5996]|uniref:response regulator transcription factor n=1 Tax=Anaerococcus sp. Marseille-Q5996 TaxID=2972769 RepID=UPI0021CA46C8|nr:response regulator transcription factor [Anaerococcus sp. Marseille-Q5996]
MRILIAEDEKNIREGLAEFLTDCGYQIYQAEDGQQGLEVFKKEKIDLALLDIKMPYMTGIELLKEIRKTSDMPVLFLTAYNDEDYKLQAFSALVDGYIEKPFSLRLVKFRIEALIKKHYKNKDLFQYKNVEVDFVSYKAFLDGKEVDMNAKEFEILHFLLENKDRVLTREQILDNVWKDSEDIPYDRVIDVYIKELRKKLKLDCIVTIRNVGYKLELK